MARLYSGGPLIDRKTPTIAESSPPSSSRASPTISDLVAEETPAPLVVGVAPSPGQASESLVHDEQETLCVDEHETLPKENQPEPVPVELAPDSIVKVSSKNLDHGSLHSPPVQSAWAKKLNFSTISASQQAPCNSRVASEMWPSLCVANNNGSHHGRKLQNTQRPIQKLAAMEDDLRFPWAAKMNPASRNLYRAIEPEYLEDGTPKE